MAMTPPVLAAFAIGEIGSWAIHELARQVRLREKRPDSPSLRGTPTPEDLESPWKASPRTLADRLRLGSRLADLDPTLDHTLLRTTLPSGKTVIRARPGGMKGWLEDRRVAIPYSTAMRYKKLAQRLRQLLSLDDRIPLEWLVDGLPTNQSLPPDLAAPSANAKRQLSRLLSENRSLAALTRTVEQKLGIVRLIAVRRVPLRASGLKSKSRKPKYFSEISHSRTVTVTPARLESTKTALLRILKAHDLSGTALHLQNRLKHWLLSLNH
jgi:hypothetical protein